MIDFQVLFSVCIGGAMALLGTLLSNFLQNRLEQRHIRREAEKERLTEIRRYLETCLEFVDLVSIPTVVGPKEFQKAIGEWRETIHEHLEKWKSLPVNGSARVLYTDDKEVLDGLAQIDQMRLTFYFNYLSLIEKGEMTHLDDKRDELKQIVRRLGKRLDQILEDI